MIKRFVHLKCDIDGCNAEEQHEDTAMIPAEVNMTEIQSVPPHVIFETEQTEGRSTTPYTSLATLHLCSKHIKKVMEGNMIFASGAQGHNRYYFKKD